MVTLNLTHEPAHIAARRVTEQFGGELMELDQRDLVPGAGRGPAPTPPRIRLSVGESDELAEGVEGGTVTNPLPQLFRRVVVTVHDHRLRFGLLVAGQLSVALVQKSF